MKHKRVLLFFMSCVQLTVCTAQVADHTAQTNSKRLTDFPVLVMADIPGAPTLSSPIIISGSTGPLMSQGHGLAAPALYDMDGDHLKDLLIGEFGSGMEFGRYMGNFIRVYQNIGTDTTPAYSGKFYYARPPFYILTNGTPYSVDQFCCIGFTPQFTDLDSDGHVDMVTGQYYGEVSWFRGSDQGFYDGKPLAQEGNPRDPDRKQFIKNQTYWSYSSASFGDLTDDGKQDLIVGGLGGLRLSKNIGTQSEPRFGSRELLLDVESKPLRIHGYSEHERKSEDEDYIAGDYKVTPVVVDWDNDGVLDLLVTNSYSHKGNSVVDFFKGRKVNGEQRYGKAVPLFVANNSEKAFPGSSPHIFITDYNSDGVNDLLIGVSVVTINGKFSSELSWKWESDYGLNGAGKDPSNLLELPEERLLTIKKNMTVPAGLNIDEYMSIRHQGYVFVMLGSKPANKTNIQKRSR